MIVSKVEGPTAIHITGEHLKVWTVWFINDPVSRAASAVANHLTAVVEFQKGNGGRPFEPFVGRWTKTPHADARGWAESGADRSHYTFANEIDLPLTPARAMLMRSSPRRCGPGGSR